MADQIFPILHLAGRIMFGMIFVGSGMGHLFKMEETAAYAASRGLPVAKPATLVSGIMILLGGLSVMLGWHRFIGAGLLVMFLVPAAFLMHAFWKETDPVARQNEMAHFMKDLSLAGAAILVALYSGTWWPHSIGG